MHRTRGLFYLQVRPHEDKVGGLDGHVGAGADGEPDVGRRERGRVVDAVAHLEIKGCQG